MRFNIFNIETVILFGQFLKSINAKYFTNLHLFYEFPQSSDFPHSKSELLFPKKYQNVPQNCSRTFKLQSSTASHVYRHLLHSTVSNSIDFRG